LSKPEVNASSQAAASAYLDTPPRLYARVAKGPATPAGPFFWKAGSPKFDEKGAIQIFNVGAELLPRACARPFTEMCCLEHLSAGQEHIVTSTGILNQGISGMEENVMRFTNRYISSLVLVAALAVPAAMLANAMPQASVQVRFYDRDHKDYHNWDDREDHSYRLYLSNHHKPYVEFNSQHSRDQRNYWNWRHSHPDRD
jgi:hypothetical protein